MTEEPSDGSDRSPRGSGRLWTDPREEEEHTRWLAPRTEVQPPPPAEEHASARAPARGPVGRVVVLATLVAFVLFGAGFLGATLLRGGDSSGDLAALPAAPGKVAPDARSRAVRQVYASARDAIVRVDVRTGAAQTVGTGFLVDSGGTVVTAAHVVSGASRVQVRFGDSSTDVGADVVGSDASSDLAVLRVDASKAKSRTPLALADSDDVRVGDLALAIGYPFGGNESVTQGIVSGVGRAIEAPNGFAIDKVIQTDAPINPGNSGGPLLDGAGRVIGVNSQIATTAGGGGNVGIGFAVPSNTVREVVPRLRAGGTIRRAYLGISFEPNAAGEGALVTGVAAGGPAERGGILPQDVISRVGGTSVRAAEDISTAVRNRRPGDRIDIEVERAGARQTLRVTLGTQPAGTPPGLSTP
jgi:putative serine protease PepD